MHSEIKAAYVTSFATATGTPPHTPIELQWKGRVEREMERNANRNRSQG